MDKISLWMQQHRRSLFIGGPVLLFIVIAIFYLLNRHSISTDDAYIKAANASINANVAGQVSNIYVHDNQMVKQGDVLFSLDQRPYKLAVSKAKAELANAYLSIQALKTVYKEKAAEVQAAQDTLCYEKEELARQTKMTASGLSSQMELNKVTNAFNNATQHLIAAQQQQANILAQLNGDPEISAENLPIIHIALANLHQALLNLSYTIIKAPIDGVVTKVENLQKGDYVQTGAPVFALISDTDIWAEANFKETQLTDLKSGQKASIQIDAYPNKKWTGHLVSQSPGTGSSFALLPPENATGNWVKIVQRVPVRIAIDNLNGMELASGLSATVTVDTAS